MNLYKLEEGELYDIAKKSYNDVYNNIMSRGKNKKLPTFLGNRSTILEKENFSNLITNDYLVSPRPNRSIKLLMLIGSIDKNNEDARYLFFIDRELNYWTIENLPSIQECAQILFDGELILPTNALLNKKVISVNKGEFIYHATDLLYGPSNPTFATMEGKLLKLHLGSSFAMIGPKANARWPFSKRYNILRRIILSDHSPIYQYNNHIKIPFRIVICPYFSVKELFPKLGRANKVHKYICDSVVDKHRNCSLVFTRNDDLCGENKSIVAQNPQPYIHISLQKSPSNHFIAGVLDQQHLFQLDIPVIVPLETAQQQYKEGEIVLCSVKDGKLYLEYKVPYMKYPDSIETLHAILREQKDPVNLNLLCVVFDQTFQQNKRMKNQVLDQLGLTFKYRCALRNKDPRILFPENTATLKKFEEIINRYRMDPNIEIETKINVPFSDCLLPVLFKGEEPDVTEECVLIYTTNSSVPGKTSQTKVSYGILGSHRLALPVIKNTPIGKLTVPKNEIMKICGYDIHSLTTYVSNVEKYTKKTLFTLQSDKITYRHQRKYEINGMPENNTPNILWRLDITLYGDSDISERGAKDDFTNNPKMDIRIRYAPGEQERNALEYCRVYPTDEILKQTVFAFSGTNQFQEVSLTNTTKMLLERIEKIRNVPIHVVVNDYCRVLVWLFNILFAV